VLNTVLREAQFEPDPVIRTCCERGWIDHGDGKHLGKKRRVEREEPRLVVIRREACDAVNT
jgi:hypothetical protein